MLNEQKMSVKLIIIGAVLLIAAVKGESTLNYVIIKKSFQPLYVMQF